MRKKFKVGDVVYVAHFKAFFAVTGIIRRCCLCAGGPVYNLADGEAKPRNRKWYPSLLVLSNGTVNGTVIDETNAEIVDVQKKIDELCADYRRALEAVAAPLL